MSEFIYCLTRPGSEPLLKQEVKEFHPGWHFAFSRPGVVTFKAPRPLESVESIPYLRFARRRGLSLGRGGEEEARIALVALGGSSAQIYSRESLTWAEGDRGDGTAEEFEARKQSLGGVSAASASGAIHDFIEVDPGKWIWGVSSPGELEFRGEAGLSGLVLPAEAPSRAYLKLEEVLEYYGVRVEAEDSVLDLGCAPGGMTYAWLKRGARVTGVDRAEMAPEIERDSRFRWVATNLATVRDDEIPRRLDWVSLDVHAQPSVSLREAMPLIENRNILGFFVNLKIGRPGIVKDILLFERELAAHLGLVRYCTKQLPSNKDELAFFGVTPAGLKRGKFPPGKSPVMRG